MMAYTDFDFKIHVHPRQDASTMSKCLEEVRIPKCMTKGKTTLKDPPKGTIHSNYRPIRCLPMMWKMLAAEIKEYNGLFLEKMLQGNQGNGWLTIYRPANSKGYQKEAKKCNHRIDWWQKRLWCNPTNLDDRASEKVQNIRQSLKVHHKNYEKLVTDSSSKRLKFSRGENPMSHLQRRLIFFTAMMLLINILRECAWGYKFTKSQEKTNYLTYMNENKQFTKKIFLKYWRLWYKQQEYTARI